MSEWLVLGKLFQIQMQHKKNCENRRLCYEKVIRGVWKKKSAKNDN